MPTIHLQAEVSREALLKAVEQLSPPELDQFVTEVLSLRSTQAPGRLTPVESELLVRIGRGLPEELQERYRELIARRQAETLLPEEHQELLRLTNDVEQLVADRVEALAELARVRGIPLFALLNDLGISTPSDG
jgi:hypothetical protein